jgi:hypothetical protein
MVEGAKDGVSQYFQFIIERRLGEAEKKLEELKQEFGRSQRETGYLKALEGLLLTYRSSGDRYLYLTNVELTGKNVEALKKEFTEQAGSLLHADYDRGYFSALADFMGAVSKLRPWRRQQAEKTADKKRAAENSTVAQ